MKNTWTTPQVEELSINGTEYHPAGGEVQDGVYTSNDGQYTIPTYGTSAGNSGEPEVGVN